MNKKIDNILLGVLWLLAATLGTCFWFNMRFGFNLFSGAHWDYLATQQATRSPVSFWFYFSFIAATFITLFVLYMLIRPRRRNIQISAPQKPSATNNAPTQSTDASQINIIPTPDTHTPAPVPEKPAISMPPRPPRLNIAPANTFAPAQSAPTTAITPMPATTMPAPQKTQTPTKQDWPEIREIFSMAGYVIKSEPFINGKKMALFAIGTDEVLWMGTVGTSTSDMRGCVNKLTKLFSDTLDGIEIHVNAFVLNPSDNTNESDILTFDSVEDLRKYISEHRNPPLDADDAENFTAYSEYITTVIEYIGKL